MLKLLLLPLTLLLSSCNGTNHSSQSQENQEQMEQPNTQQTAGAATQAQQAPIEQGIVGKVIWQAGNQMPSPDAPPSKGRGVQRTVYIYELTNGSQAKTIEGVFHTNIQTNLVTQVATDADGNFAVSLEPGMYSLFTKEEKGLYANLFDGENNIFPVEVQEGQVTTVEFLINYAASY
ncbi:carboxypeptidase regulatory-like domain-containing protein [Pontibacter diazotrophicus]|uniref:Carboxypeptidase regulatory-like domain-containing protein n=1 Tax=Pontibacter diazotrophicus TaxID=1400979 RepID=A0A3D8L906_9BACT|nr:carboxypeptidase-like regulatory domain-containing protein [Pontibacter diazotrophicus]RDV13885.1 carboxypeptidase regulatory-like domain-containing protein [Pontibacter diazotrophicus]